MGSIQLRFFGAFRNYFETEELPLEDSIQIVELRTRVSNFLKSKKPSFDQTLLDDSVFATETSVLSETDKVQPGQKIALLPPVCGG